jgi:hypothetical protein
LQDAADRNGLAVGVDVNACLWKRWLRKNLVG